MASFRIERLTRASRIGVALIAAAIAVLASLPLWAGSGTIRLAVEIFYYLALAECWNLLAGYAGLVSIGQQAFVGFGGYVLAFLTILLGVPPLVALAVAGPAAAIVAVPTALLLFRLRGAYFAIGTWVAAEVFRLIALQIFSLGGGTGISLPVSVVLAISDSRAVRDLIFYYIGLAVGLGGILMVFFWLRSRQGLALTAIRDSETAAASVGIDKERSKLAVYVIAAALTGFVGALAYLEKVRISPDAAFSVVDWSADVIFIVVIGGIGSIEGPILGTVIFFVLRGLLADYGVAYLILLGLVAVVVMLLAPRGLWGIAEKFDIHLFPVQRRLRFTEAGSA
ncbi:MAG TPA: branched-chain amino acid ABC transporter permease, partial [Stellaceae bacterium]|nr:branched-chain amino acid ABC transporter permease [Stellaceae bacterium]